MANNFYERLKDYYEKVGQVLRGEAEASSIFANTSDIGISRELIYAEFLKQHAPSKCNVYLGGFLFGENGDESKQLDIIISTDTAPRFNFHNPDGKGKSFGPVDGCIGVASIKSTLDKDQLIDSLHCIASIPNTKPLGNKVNPMIKINDYENWPYKIIYASNGLTETTILGHLNKFYIDNPSIPVSKRPDIIHVAGKYAIFKVKEGMSVVDTKSGIRDFPKVGEFISFTGSPDVQAITNMLNDLQQHASASNHINFTYTEIISKIHGIWGL